jgi:hypothetical protein
MESGEDWADKEAGAALLEKTEKVLLSKLSSSFTGQSEAARDRMARNHSAYREHIGKMIEARKEANKAKVKYESTKQLSSMRQTQESLKKEELRQQNNLP